MLSYKAPLRDMRFVREELLDFPGLFESLPGCEEFTPDLIEAILGEAAKFCENVLAPLYRSGDEEGCTWSAEGVRTPAGFREAYQQYIAGGWAALSAPSEYGGQGLPGSMNLLVEDLFGTANWAWAMYPGLSHGAYECLKAHGTPEQKATYLPRLTSGEWTGTMCLTEPQCGTDLAQVKTRAVPQKGGSYKITGTKIFISAGEHDLTENIVHIVLARLPDAPEGTRGISLFVVPKFKVKADGTLGERNAVNCGSIEHKMGIRASSTAVLNFDEAEGFMVFEPNRGLEAMFTFMNTARLGTAVQGVCHAEAAFQGALPYAKDRRSMRALSGKKDPESKADALIWHPDVRRMLLTQKAIAEGGRAMIYDALKIGDHMFNASAAGDAEGYKAFDSKLGFYTPILKGFLTEMGLEAANLGVQVFGGHGYIKEHGMEQIVRDTRIALIYEGTSAIQALDLLGRKIMGSGGELLRGFVGTVEQFCQDNAADKDLAPLVAALRATGKRLEGLTIQVADVAMKNPEEADAAAFEYLMFMGYYVLGYMWVLMARKALAKLADGAAEQAFYKAKIETARFYFQRILPRTESLALCVEAGASTLMSLAAEDFAA